MRGTYVGPIEHLKGKKALLQYRAAHPEDLFAQFDDRSLSYEGPPIDWESDEDPVLAQALGFGWHAFPRNHFDGLQYYEGEFFPQTT